MTPSHEVLYDVLDSRIYWFHCTAFYSLRFVFSFNRIKLPFSESRQECSPTEDEGCYRVLVAPDQVLWYISGAVHMYSDKGYIVHHKFHMQYPVVEPRAGM